MIAMYWLLFYDYVDDIADRRGPYREAHLAVAREAHEAGTSFIEIQNTMLFATVGQRSE